MPLIDLDSMSHQQLEEEARYWTLEPSNYKSDTELKKAINDQREARAARHFVTPEDVKSGMATKVGDEVNPKPGKEATVPTTKKATVTRPTPKKK